MVHLEKIFSVRQRVNKFSAEFLENFLEEILSRKSLNATLGQAPDGTFGGESHPVGDAQGRVF